MIVKKYEQLYEEQVRWSSRFVENLVNIDSQSERVGTKQELITYGNSDHMLELLSNLFS